jgi:hypothetical protein
MRNINSLLTVLALSFASVSAVGCATSGDEINDEYSDAQSNATIPGKVDLWKSTDGQFRFHVVSGNGRILLTSEAYTTRTGALNGVLSTLDNGVDPAQYQVNKTDSGKYNLHLRAANYETIGFTQAYSTKSNATRAIGSCVSAVTTYLDKVESNTTGARVEVAESDSGFHFNLHAQNGEVILSSEHYSTKAAAWNGAFAVQDAAALDGSFEIKTSTDNRFYFTLTAENGQVVGVSQLYTSKQSAEGGIASVKSTLSTLDLL